MCGCGVNLVPVGAASLYEYTIPVSEVQSGSTRANFKLKFCLSPEKVNQALSVIKVNGSDPLRVSSMKDMEHLADYHDAGLDRKNYNQDINALLSKIVYTQEELSKSECNMALTY